MNLHEVVSDLIINTKGSMEGGLLSITPDSSLGLFFPEIILCVTIVALLAVRLFDGLRWLDVFWVALIGAGAAFFSAAFDSPETPQRVELFTGMLVYDTFTVFIRSILLLFVVLFTIFTKLSGVPDREEGADIYSLVLGATLGMCLMASANHLLMVFMAVEMASVPSYALAGLMKGRKKASEAALKYAIYGAGAAGVMLYGISLVAGLFNTAHLPTLASELAARGASLSGGELAVLALGGLMIMVGLAFKLSAVPFHFWCPDVFEGATAEVNAFLSVASKAAALALLVRVALGVGLEAPEALQAGWKSGQAAQVETEDPAKTASLFAVADEVKHEKKEDHRQHDEEESKAKAATPLAPSFIAKLIAFIAIITCTFGNLAAYGQTNIKRLLAYSTIAHAGYMMMAVPPILALAMVDREAAERGVASLALYLSVYLFMNLGAFAIVAFLRNAMHSEEISDYSGLVRHCPGIAISFALILFSLVGLPPLAGFIGKFAVFASLAESWVYNPSQKYLLWMLLAGGVNTAISLFYYLRVVRRMILDPDSETRGPVALPMVSLQGAFVAAMTLPTVALIVCWDFLNQIALTAAKQLLG